MATGRKKKRRLAQRASTAGILSLFKGGKGHKKKGEDGIAASKADASDGTRRTRN